MSVTVRIRPDLAQRLEALVDENIYSSKEEALEDANRLIVAVKGKLYSREEVREVLGRYLTSPSDRILQDVKEEEP